MTENQTGSAYVSGSQTAAPAQPTHAPQPAITRAEFVQLQENIGELRKLHISTLIFVAITLVAAIVAAVTATWTAYVIYKVIDGLRQAFPS